MTPHNPFIKFRGSPANPDSLGFLRRASHSLVTSAGWSYDGDEGVYFPAKPEVVTEEHKQMEAMQPLTEFIAHLERVIK